MDFSYFQLKHTKKGDVYILELKFKSVFQMSSHEYKQNFKQNL